jgi:hypothetical protein
MPPEDDPRDDVQPTREEYEAAERQVSETELVVVCVLLMASDPFPAGNVNRAKFEAMANRLARSYGYKDWLDAYHRNN